MKTIGGRDMDSGRGRFLNQIDDNKENSRLCFNKKSRYISLAGAITDNLAEEFFDIMSGFEMLSSKKPLTIYVNSDGGGAYPMFKIYDCIKNSPLFITTVVAGYASSAGFIIFLAGDYRKALPHAFLGFHAPTVYFTGEGSESPAESAESAAHQGCLLNAMVEIVKNNSNMSEKAIRKYFRILTRIDTKTALKLGLVNEVIVPPKKVLPKIASLKLKKS